MQKLKQYGCVLALTMLAVRVQAMPQNNLSSHASAATTASALKSRPLPSSTKTATINSSGSQIISRGDSDGAETLPVRRVVLYKSGVGYFEHQGRVQGNQAVHIDFTSGQLNDVLQSLTILDLNGGRVAGVNYNSEAPLSERLGTLRLPLDGNTNISQFYGALRGARLEVRSGTTAIVGRLLSVERKTRVSGGTTLEVDLATIVSDTGEVRSVELTPNVDVRLADRDVSGEVGRYLGLLASVRQQDLRRMSIATAGSGDRQLYVSYISETPVWKTTYRIVLPSKPGEDPLLQGWAIVDNTVGEDWENVELALVAGAPQSFIQPLSQPLYARRPVIALAQTAQLAPQTHESAMLGGIGGLSGVITDPSGAVVPRAEVKIYSEAGGLAAQTNADGEGKYEIPDLPAGRYRAQFSAAGFNTAEVTGLSLGGGREQTQNVSLQVGSSTQTVTVTASAEEVLTSNASLSGSTSGGNIGSGRGLGNANGRYATNTPLTSRNYTNVLALNSGANAGYGVAGGTGVASEMMLNDARQAMEAVAHGTDLGDLFEYKLKDHVTIRKNESALVPIVQARVAAEKVSMWNLSLNSQRPLRALWLTNSSALTLDGGSFSVLENEAFAGEGLTDSIKPGERRLISYAADLGMRVDAKAQSTPERVTRVSIAHGAMEQFSELRQETIYTVRNDDTTPRTLLIEHPVRNGWKLGESDAKPEETASDLYRFRVSVEPKAAVTLAVHESRPLHSRFELVNLTDNNIELWIQQKSINPEMEAAFRKIMEQKNRVAAFDDEVMKRDEERQKIYDDQQRLRENLKALKGSAEERALTQRYTQQLADQETRLDALQRESADMQAKSAQAQADLDKMIGDLSLEAVI
jgi:hypothetical protein